MKNRNIVLLLLKEMEKYEWKWLLGVFFMRFYLNNSFYLFKFL